MADTVISALTAASAALDTDRIPIQISPFGSTDDRYLTPAQIKTFVNTAPVYAAGSASAGTWPKLTAGTLLTTAEVGALELDANCLYGCSDAGNRGVIPLYHYCRLASTYTLTSQIAAQKLFNASANGRLTLETGTYMFQSQFSISGLSATTGNGQFGLLGAGSATLGSILYHVVGIDGASGTAATQTGCTAVGATTPASMVTGGTNAVLNATLMGTFAVTVAGTIVPSIALVTAAAGVVAIGSYFLCYRIGSTSSASVGQWD
jgi:hypothetical protein